MGLKIAGQIEKVNGKELSYSEFVERYMEKNQPVVLTGVMGDWRACKDWVTLNGQPNLQFFATHFGKSRVQVADCGTREFTDQKRVELSVSEFVDQWREDSMPEGSNGSTHVVGGKPLLYLKDWHFVKELGLLFMLMFSGHTVGQQINKKSCVYNIFDDVDETKFPGFNKVIWLECIQEQNEIIFVPSGWYHQVHNLEDTISINHNWFNGYNLFWVWDLLLRDYNEAKEYIEDIKDICDDFEGLCQRNLAANTGMNFYDFLIFLAHMSLANLVHLCKVYRGTENCIWSLSPMAQQLTFNLMSIQKIALKMKATEERTRNYRIHLDFRDTLDDPEFGKLCSVLGRKYEEIHKQQKFDCQTKESSINAVRDMNIIGTCTSQECTNPEDLVKFIDHAIVHLRGIYGEENV